MREGVIGRFALDFVTVKNDRGEWESYAIEINLRKGGTTHPFLTLQFLTDGAYDPEQGVFTTPRGEHKYFVASDHLQSPTRTARSRTTISSTSPRARSCTSIKRARQGVVFHMMNALGEHGLVGLTAVGNSHEDAKQLYERTVAAIDAEAGRAGL